MNKYSIVVSLDMQLDLQESQKLTQMKRKWEIGGKTQISWDIQLARISRNKIISIWTSRTKKMKSQNLYSDETLEHHGYKC